MTHYKIIHITAAYKPAFIYGGPTMSVAKLCEALGGLEVRSLGVEGFNDIEVEVLTTTANGKTELAISPGTSQLVDGVRVTYYKRITKDHTHFSPALLMGLRKVLRQAQHDNRLNKKITNEQRLSSVVHRLSTSEQRSTNNDLIIHIHAWWNLVSILSCWVAKCYNVPVILSPRGMLTDYTLGNKNVGIKSIINSLLGKNLLKYCHIHATSEKEKQDILKFINPKSITVIPNLVEGVASSEYQVASIEYQVASSEYQVASIKYQVASSEYQVASSEYQVASSKYQVASSEYQVASSKYQEKDSSSAQPTSAFKLIFLSRIEEKKGLELLFETLAKFDVNWNLTIAGSGEEEYKERLALIVDRLGLSNRINWVGQVKNEDKFKLLAEHDLMVLTSYNENFANVVIESLSVGTPVLLSNEVGLADYVIAQDLGWIAELSSDSIAEQLNQSYKAIVKREKIRIDAPKLIVADYNDATLVEKYMELYKQVI